MRKQALNTDQFRKNVQQLFCYLKDYLINQPTYFIPQDNRRSYQQRHFEIGTESPFDFNSHNFSDFHSLYKKQAKKGLWQYAISLEHVYEEMEKGDYTKYFIIESFDKHHRASKNKILKLGKLLRASSVDKADFSVHKGNQVRVAFNPESNSLKFVFSNIIYRYSYTESVPESGIKCIINAISSNPPVYLSEKVQLVNKMFFHIKPNGSVLVKNLIKKSRGTGVVNLSLCNWAYYKNTPLEPFLRSLIGIHPNNGYLSHAEMINVGISNSITHSSTNMRALLSHIAGRKVPKSLISIPFTIAAHLASCMPFLEANQFHKLMQFWKQSDFKIPDQPTINVLVKDMKDAAQTILYRLLFDRIYSFERLSEPCLAQNEAENAEMQYHHLCIYLSDYLRLCFQLKAKVNINIQSLRRLDEEHDHLALQLNQTYRRPEFTNLVNTTPFVTAPFVVNPKFSFLQSDARYQILLIDNMEKLVEEGNHLQHCVISYTENICEGQCGIYSICDTQNNERYTAEVRISPDKVFYINQVKGKYNTEAPPHLHEVLEHQLDAHNTLFQNHFSLPFSKV